jgi:hypothetical protein
VEKQEMSNDVTLNAIRRYTIIGILIGSALLLALPAGETSVGNPILTSIVDKQFSCNIPITAQNEGNSCSILFNPVFSQTPIVRAVVIPNTDLGQVGSRTSVIGDFSFISPGSTPVTWSAMPNALTEFLGTTWHEGAMDFTPTQDCVLIVNVVVAGTATAILKVQYSADGGSTWADALPGQDVSIASTGLQINGNLAVATGAQVLGGVLVRLVGSGGNGVVSPQFGDIELFCASQLLHQEVLSYSALSSTGVTLNINLGFPPSTTVTYHPSIDVCFPCSN